LKQPDIQNTGAEEFINSCDKGGIEPAPFSTKIEEFIFILKLFTFYGIGYILGNIVILIGIIGNRSSRQVGEGIHTQK